MSASAVLPEPRAPMMATSPGLSGITGVVIHGRINDFDSRDHLRWCCRCRRFGTDMRAATRIDAPLAESIKLQPTLDPGEPVSERRCDVIELVGVTSMQAGLQPAVSNSHFIGGKIPL